MLGELLFILQFCSSFFFYLVDGRLRVNTYTHVRNAERCYQVYGPPLTEGVRPGCAGTRVPARLRRTSAANRPISARLLATFTVARTLHYKVPHTCAAQTQYFLRYGLDVFHLLR